MSKILADTNPLVLLALLCLLTGQVGCKNIPAEETGDIPPPLIPQEQRVEKPKPRTVDNRIQVGDSLELFVDEDPSFNDVYKVREGGDIIIPRVGRILVEGMSLSSATKAIRDVLEERQLTKATVILDRVLRAPDKPQAPIDPVTGAPSDQKKLMVFITGKVSRPGQHLLPMPKGRLLGVYEAILISGGMTRFGDEQKVYVLRTGENGTKHKIPVNIRHIKMGEANDPPIGEGDIVVVPEKFGGF